MNEQILRKIDEAVTNHVLSEIHAPGFSEITDAVDAQDLAHQRDNFSHLLHLEITNNCQRLRHRAHMMRLRADQFDKIADDAEKQGKIVISTSEKIVSVVGDIEELLHTHAHIEPTRVE